MKKKMTILAVLLLAVVVTAYSVSGTYAKYTSSLDVSDEARVAHWYLDKGVITDTFKLFERSYKLENDTYVKALDDNTIPPLKKNVVAPGTKGEYKFSIEGEFETDFTLKVDLLTAPWETTKSVNNIQLKDEAGAVIYDPIDFSLDGGTTWFKYSDLQTELNKTLAKTIAGEDRVYEAGIYPTDGTIPPLSRKIEATLMWKWDYSDAETNDVYDTQLGNMFETENVDPNIVLALRITATQHVPDSAK